MACIHIFAVVVQLELDPLPTLLLLHANAAPASVPPSPAFAESSPETNARRPDHSLLAGLSLLLGPLPHCQVAGPSFSISSGVSRELSSLLQVQPSCIPCPPNSSSGCASPLHLGGATTAAKCELTTQPTPQNKGSGLTRSAERTRARRQDKTLTKKT